MFPILPAIGAAIVLRFAYKYISKYKSLADLKKYGETVNCPYVSNEDVEAYRARLVKIRDSRLESVKPLGDPKIVYTDEVC